MAAKTPPHRNRYVDFLRAASILVVISGHWLMTTAYYVDGSLTSEHVFKVQPLTQWLTWLFQVMPIFFIVGGYSNAVSITSAHRKGIGYAGWLAARLHRLIIPLLALLIAWAAIVVIMGFFDASPALIQLSSRAALIPTWFLAIYIMAAILAPFMYRVWKRMGFISFWVLVSMAVLMDIAYFTSEVPWLSWSSYFWVWLAIHNLGFAWRDERVAGVRRLIVYSALALGIMGILVYYGPYPLAMVGSPDQVLSNTTPPKITLLALGIFQFGLLLAAEKPVRRALASLRLWAATVLINSMIMTIYLWHLTLLILFIGLLYLAGGFGLGLEPGSLNWWLTRPIWILVLALLLIPVSLLLSPLERISRSPDARIPSAPRQIAGAIMICLGVALLARFGYGGGPLPGLDFAAFLLVALGAAGGGLLSALKSGAARVSRP